MKKIFALFLVAASVVACNNDNAGNAESNPEDSALQKIDSLGEARVDSVNQATDSLQKTVEATFDKTDSANKALVDSANKK